MISPSSLAILPDFMADHIRIDEGVKRGPKKLNREERKELRKEARQSPRSARGTFLPACTTEQRKAIVEAIPDQLLAGKTTTQIAEEHGLAPSTIRSWIIGNPDVEQARGLMIAQELASSIEEIQDASEPMALARGREGFRAWSWIAERRESRLYGPKQEVAVTIDHQVAVEHSLTTGASELLGRIRQGNAAVLTTTIEVHPEPVDTQPID